MLVLAEVAGPLTGNADGRRPGEARRRPADERRRRRATRPAGCFDDPPTNAAGRRHRDRVGRGRRAAVPALHLGRGAARTSSSARRGATSCSPTTAARSPASRSATVPGAGARRRRAATLRPVRARADPEPVPSASGRRSRTRRSRRRGRRRRTRSREGPVTAGARRRPRLAHVQPARCTTGSRSAASRSAPAPAVVRGGDGAWSVSDGVTVALLRLDGRDAAPCCRAPGLRGGDDRRRPARGAARRRARGHAARRDRAVAAASSTCSASDGDAREFVVEVEHDGAATLRFGDGVHGRRPETGTEFEATYRVGNGIAGQRRRRRDRARRDAGRRRSLGATNPLAGRRRHRPRAGRRGAPRRARGVPRPGARGHRGRLRARSASATRTSSARPRRSAGPARGTRSSSPPTALGGRAGRRRRSRPSCARHLEPFRMAGYDLEVDGPRFVPLEVALHVCVEPDYFRVAREGRRARRALEPARAPTARSASSIPTASRSASPSTCRRSSPRRRRSPASSR